ncbi:hypothetical protein Tbis_2912 [Thermobispora bispora DSM 43833]|uniref:Uncharacterized protein n=1 Tax=Thermobispora bispora (strain ATCC 19993 / DSM 43833 / CBS 139.67 / JCM 10125 / KCTC 9307 / NBRC 14880 / R51) TaxID=469371 RepID=D6Y6W9_THEBD|nr:hypothetical protein Tbis_2912 [Thermobispora bispora DSM 43833]
MGRGISPDGPPRHRTGDGVCKESITLCHFIITVRSMTRCRTTGEGM